MNSGALKGLAFGALTLLKLCLRVFRFESNDRRSFHEGGARRG